MKNLSAVADFVLGSLFTLLLVSEFAFKENNVKGMERSHQWNVPALPEQFLLPMKKHRYSDGM